MLKLAAWSVLLLATAVVLWPKPTLRFLDDFFEGSLPIRLEGRIETPDLGTANNAQKNPFRNSRETSNEIAAASEADRLAVFRDPVQTKTPESVTDSGTEVYASQYSTQHDKKTQRPSFSYDPSLRDRRGTQLNSDEIPLLEHFDANTKNTPHPPPSTTHRKELPKIKDRSQLDAIAPMVSLPGGTFRMGRDTAAEADQRPRHSVRLSPFHMDCYEVTNRQFQLFVQETGYRTTAEEVGWSYVFDTERKAWIRMLDACWWNPTGSNSGGPENAAVAARYEHPVVHISWNDAVAFCRWAGKRLPTEAEWEYAAKGGLLDAKYPWGDQRMSDGVQMANYWQGWFPNENALLDGFSLTAPVGSFPANRYGLYDVGGNAWEWCADRYKKDYYRRSPMDNPLGPIAEEGENVALPMFRVQRDNGRFVGESVEGIEDVSLRIIRGGSFLSAENGDAGYRVTSRGNQPQTLSFQDVGFRCAE